MYWPHIPQYPYRQYCSHHIRLYMYPPPHPSTQIAPYWMYMYLPRMLSALSFQYRLHNNPWTPQYTMLPLLGCWCMYQPHRQSRLCHSHSVLPWPSNHWLWRFPMLWHSLPFWSTYPQYIWLQSDCLIQTVLLFPYIVSQHSIPCPRSGSIQIPPTDSCCNWLPYHRHNMCRNHTGYM